MISNIKSDFLIYLIEKRFRELKIIHTLKRIKRKNYENLENTSNDLDIF